MKVLSVMNRAPETVAMREYMDAQHQINPLFQSGQDWYAEQAFRALNQSVGRCIRHSRDYGAIFFLESRFKTPSFRSGLSKWYRDSIQVINSREQMLSDLSMFYKNCERDFPKNREGPPLRMNVKRETSLYFTSKNEQEVENTSMNAKREAIEMEPHVWKKEPEMEREIISLTDSQESFSELSGRQSLPHTQPSVFPLAFPSFSQPVSVDSTKSVASLQSSQTSQTSQGVQVQTQSSQPTQPPVITFHYSLQEQPQPQLPVQPSSIGSSQEFIQDQPQLSQPVISSQDSIQGQFYLSQSNSLSQPSIAVTSLTCPCCQETIHSSSWRQIRCNLSMIKLLLECRSITLQENQLAEIYHPKEGSSLKAWSCEEDDLLPLLSHFCIDKDGLIQVYNRGENSNEYYSTEDRIVYDYVGGANNRYKIVYCKTQSNTLFMGEDAMNALIPVGVVIVKSSTRYYCRICFKNRKELVHRFVFLPCDSDKLGFMQSFTQQL